MNTRTPKLLVGFAALVLTVPTAVDAACNGSINFAQYYSGLFGPNSMTSPSMLASFWALGFGNPSPGAGTDNGSSADENWIVPYSGKEILLGDWQTSGFDGCIVGKIAAGKSREIMVVELSDYRAALDSYFALAVVGRDLAAWPEFDFSTLGDVTLAPVPKPLIVSSTLLGPHSIRLDVAGPSESQLEAGFFSDGSVDLRGAISGYRLFMQSTSANTPPTYFFPGTWTPVTDTVPIGQLSTVMFDCARPATYLALSLVYESGFESPYLSRPSTRLECQMCEGDADVDGWSPSASCAEVDCNDGDPNIYPHAAEINDGKDNECPGDAGFGSIDEVSGLGRFETPGDKTVLSWPSQSGATGYQVVRSTEPTFTESCTSFPSGAPSVTDLASPPENVGLYYLIRATAPHLGSWGQTSAGAERATGCP